MAENARTQVSMWIALLDAAEHLHQTADPRDPHAMQRVGHAIDILIRHEHTLTDVQREQARRTLWLRDRGEPLPTDTSEWQRCRCCRCQLSHRLHLFAHASTTPVPVQEPTPIQGELLHV